MRIIVITLFSMLLNSSAFSQDLPDSIQSILNDPNKSDSVKVEVLNQFSQITVKNNPDLNLIALNEAMKRNPYVGSYTKAITLINLGVHYMYLNELQKTDSLYTLALQYCMDSGNEKCIGQSLSELGNLNYYLQNDSLALEYWIKSVKVYEKLKDEYRLGRLYNNISLLYNVIEDNERAFEYLKKSVKMKENVGDERGLGSGYYNLGRTYYLLGYKDSANVFLNKARVIREKYNDLRGLAITYGTAGLNYKDLNVKDSALYYITKAIELDKAMKDSIAMEEDMIGYLEILVHFNQHQKALEIGSELLKTAKSSVNKYKAYEYLAIAAAKTGKYKDAYNYHTQYSSFRDEVFNADRAATIDELEKKYDTEKKEQRIADLQQKNTIAQLEAQKEKQWRYLLILAAVTLSLVVGLLFNRYRLKHQAERALAEKNEQLSELNKTKNRLFSIIAHDLKSPLSAFSMLVGALKENSQSLTREELDEYLNTILDSSEDLNKLLINLLDWARIQSNNMVYKPEEEDINSTVNTSYEPLRLNAKLKNLSFINETSGVGYFDNIMIVTVLRNLISNAIKFTPEGGEISVSNEDINGFNVIAVRDTGIGMTKQELEALFENKRLSSSSKNGTGLGLIICRDLIEKHGGKIEVDSALGKGSVFKVYLPAKQEHMQVA